MRVGRGYIYLASGFSNGQHGVYLPDDIPHLVNDIFKVSVLEGDLLDQLVVLLCRGLVGVPSLLLQLHSSLAVLLQRDQRLDRKEVHATGVLLEMESDQPLLFCAHELPPDIFPSTPAAF